MLDVQLSGSSDHAVFRFVYMYSLSYLSIPFEIKILFIRVVFEAERTDIPVDIALDDISFTPECTSPGKLY